MKLRKRSVVSVFLAVGVLAALAPPAQAAIVVGDRFDGPALRPAWRQVNSTWRTTRGTARVNPSTVDPITNIGYAVISTKGSHKAQRVQMHVRLSPAKTNIGIVAPFKNVENHLFCRVELTPAHPLGYLVIGNRLRGSEPNVEKDKSGLNITAGQIYTLVSERHRRIVTCAIVDGTTTIESIRYRMTPAELKAFGGGKKAGMRIRIVVDSKRRDEDDGRSKFLDFRVSTI